jgi:hypothetical protein
MAESRRFARSGCDLAPWIQAGIRSFAAVRISEMGSTLRVR